MRPGMSGWHLMEASRGAALAMLALFAAPIGSAANAQFPARELSVVHAVERGTDLVNDYPVRLLRLAPSKPRRPCPAVKSPEFMGGEEVRQEIEAGDNPRMSAETKAISDRFRFGNQTLPRRHFGMDVEQRTHGFGGPSPKTAFRRDTVAGHVLVGGRHPSARALNPVGVVDETEEQLRLRPQ